MQAARFVDVTRSFFPCDPNTFPESLFEARTVENRVPITAYKGYNIMPTSYGYRSYFGTNQRLDIDGLAAKVDYVFVFQNASLQNILIALCDSGIWYKVGSTSGAWTNAYATTPYNPVTATTYYPWSYCIINDELYCYRQNWPSYQKLASQVAAPGFALTNVVPSFLNMAGQLGIFRAGNRLGFWDSADSTAWSALDDFADFTPSLETLAGSAIFSQVIGRIVNIVGHAQGFMIYSTKSAVFIREAPESLFQWEPVRILDNSGIAYRRQVTASVPDNVHYAYTSTGLYEIKNAVPKIIVPQVTDFFKKAPGPKFLRFLEGRYLFVQSLDPAFVNGIPQFTDETVPPTTITFPGSNLTLQDRVNDALTQGSNGFCPIYDDISDGGILQPEGESPDEFWRPIWTAYLSQVGQISPDVVFETTPCSVTSEQGVAVEMNPKDADTYGLATTDITNKTPVLGDVFLDGNWTITRFVQAQLAIWGQADKANAARLAAILSRTHTSTKTSETPNDISSFTETRCDIGQFVTKWSAPVLQISRCSVKLTRFALESVKLRVYTSKRVVGQFMPASVINRPLLYYRVNYSTNGSVGCTASTPWDAMNPCRNLSIFPNPLGPADMTVLNMCDSYFGETLSPGNYIQTTPVLDACPSGTTPTGCALCNKPAYYLNQHTTISYIEDVPQNTALKPDTAIMVITAWKETTTGRIIPAATCDEPFADTGDTPIYPQPSDTGELCSEPFPPFVIEGTPPVTVEWPDQTVVIPPSTFLLQDGTGEPIYPTYEGAYVYDTHLEKWGAYKGRHKQLLDYSPINTFGPSQQSYPKFGMMAGMMSDGGSLFLFDDRPYESSITYGKFGYDRRGVTSPEELVVHMGSKCTFTVTVETSLSGKTITAGLSKTVGYADADVAVVQGSYPGKWQNLRIDGIFDINYVEYRAQKKGTR